MKSKILTMLFVVVQILTLSACIFQQTGCEQKLMHGEGTSHFQSFQGAKQVFGAAERRTVLPQQSSERGGCFVLHPVNGVRHIIWLQGST